MLGQRASNTYHLRYNLQILTDGTISLADVNLLLFVRLFVGCHIFISPRVPAAVHRPGGAVDSVPLRSSF